MLIKGNWKMPTPDGRRGGHDFIEGDIDRPDVIKILDRRLRQKFSSDQMDVYYLPECYDELWRLRQLAYDTFPAWAPMSTSQCIAVIEDRVCHTNLPPGVDKCHVCGSLVPISPQRMAFESDADLLFSGGSGGGGKTALLSGIALMESQQALFLRKHADHLLPLIKEAFTFYTNKTKHRSINHRRWEFWDENLTIAWGGMSTEQDRNAVQGNPRDKLLVDECVQLTRADLFYAMNWNRSDAVGVECQVVSGTNPPLERIGAWFFDEVYEWVRKDGKQSPSGKKLYFMPVIGSATNEMRRCEPDEVEYEVMPNGKRVENRPISKTFVSMNVSDNYFYGAEYMKKLNAQDPIIRDKLKYGIFSPNFANQEKQVIPTEWVDVAIRRWESRAWLPSQQDTLGVDVGREEGGDLSVISSRYNNWFGRLVTIPGIKNVTDGIWLAGRIVQERENLNCPVYIDGTNVGTSPYDQLGKLIGKEGMETANGGIGMAVNVNFGARPWCIEIGTGMFYEDVRTMLWLRFRDMLNPANNNNIALPPDPENKLLLELTTPLLFRRGNKYKVEKKEDVKKRIGRSTDRADAVILSAIGYSCPHKFTIEAFLSERRFDMKGELVNKGEEKKVEQITATPRNSRPGSRNFNMGTENVVSNPKAGAWLS